MGDIACTVITRTKFIYIKGVRLTLFYNEKMCTLHLMYYVKVDFWQLLWLLTSPNLDLEITSISRSGSPYYWPVVVFPEQTTRGSSLLKYNGSNPSLLKISVELDHQINLKQFCVIFTILQIFFGVF